MGHRITQRIYSCDVCGKIPEDGEYMWYMGVEIWCSQCCDSFGGLIDEKDNEEKDEKSK